MINKLKLHSWSTSLRRNWYSIDNLSAFSILFLQIITAGSEASVRHWSINGSPMAVIPSGHQHAFSLKFNFNNHQYEVNNNGPIN